MTTQSPVFIDTNIFLRFITQDNPAQAQASLNLFTQIQEGKVAVVTSKAVVCEIVFTLSSKKLYAFDRETVKNTLIPLLLLQKIELPKKNVYCRALELFGQTKFDFQDCLTVAQMEEKEIDEIYSFDKDFDHFEGIKRKDLCESPPKSISPPKCS